MRITLPIDNLLLDKIDLVKQNLNIKTKAYPQALSEICDSVLRMQEEFKQVLIDFKGISEKIFIFLQEKCDEEKYSKKEFFLALVRFCEQLDEKIKTNSMK